MPVQEPANERRISALRSEIGDLAAIVDGRKARAAMAAGGAVFLLLIAALGVHDLVTGTAGIWLLVGFDESTLRTMTLASGAMGLFLLIAVVFGKTRNREMESQLADLEQQLAEMLPPGDTPESS